MSVVSFTDLCIAASRPRDRLSDVKRELEAVDAAVLKAKARALCFACGRGNVDVVVELLKQVGVNTLYTDSDGVWNPLHAAVQDGQLEVVRVLIGSGADIEVKDPSGFTPFLRACFHGHTEVVSELIQYQANVTAQTERMENALHLVSAEGHVDVARILLQSNKFPVNAKDEGGCTALHRASEGGHSAIISELITHKSKVNARTQLSLTPLCMASKQGHVDVVRTLLQNGARVDIECEDGTTSLHQASFYGHLEVVELLLNEQADANAVDTYGWTALHCASECGHVPVGWTLLSRGTNVELKNKDGNTALQLAKQLKKTEVENLLKDYATNVFRGVKRAADDPDRLAHMRLALCPPGKSKRKTGASQRRSVRKKQKRSAEE